VGFRVQAKRLFAQRWHFNSLKFPARGRSQSDILIVEAGEGIVPLYCFYVFQSRKHHSPELSLDPLQGCRLMRAESVARTRSKLAKKLIPHSVPWHDIVCDDEARERNLEAIFSWANGLGGRSEAATSCIQPRRWSLHRRVRLVSARALPTRKTVGRPPFAQHETRCEYTSIGALTHHDERCPLGGMSVKVCPVFN
jgi:hypothetical protein